jgi:hypothetical protein
VNGPQAIAAPARRAVTCEDVAGLLPGIMEGSDVAAPAVVRHVEQCARCQAEVATYRRLLRVLQQLRFHRLAPPAGSLEDVLSAIETEAKRRAFRSVLTGRRLTYAAGIGAATAAGSVVVIVGRARTARTRRGTAD